LRLAIASCIAAAVLMSPVAADDIWSWVQVTCAPELRMFSIHRFSVVDAPGSGADLTDNAIVAPQQKYGIYGSKSLKAQPFTCTIPRLPAAAGGHLAANGYTVKIVGHLDEQSDATSYRLIQDDVEIYLDGRSLGSMGLNPYGITMGLDWIQVTEIEGFGLFTETCAIDDATPSDGVYKRLVCKYGKYEPAKP
jgi:hypothetical protein